MNSSAEIISRPENKTADALILCVLTPPNKYRDPDLSFVLDTTLPRGDDRFWWAQYTVKVDGRNAVHARLKSVGVPSNSTIPNSCTSSRPTSIMARAQDRCRSANGCKARS